MKSPRNFFFAFLILDLLYGCAPTVYGSNGESIYRSGKNLSGTKLLDKQQSQITLFQSCSGCHGPGGKRISGCNIQWAHLSSPDKMSVPYTKELFARFIDEDLKSDGTKAQTGVHWKMGKSDTEDLIAYLKTLK